MIKINYTGNVTITLGDKKYYFHNNGTQAFFNNIAEALAGEKSLLIPTYLQVINPDDGSALSYKSPVTSLRIEENEGKKVLKLAAQVSFSSSSSISIKDKQLNLIGTTQKNDVGTVLASVLIDNEILITSTQQLLVEWELKFGDSSDTQEVNE